MRARLWLNAGLMLATLWLARELPEDMETTRVRQPLHPGEQTLQLETVLRTPFSGAYAIELEVRLPGRLSVDGFYALPGELSAGPTHARVVVSGRPVELLSWRGRCAHVADRVWITLAAFEAPAGARMEVAFSSRLSRPLWDGADPHLVLAFQPHDSAWHPVMGFLKESRGPYALAAAAAHWLILVYTLGQVALGRVRK